MVGVFVLSLPAVKTASAQVAAVELAEAQQAVARAGDAYADQYAPELIGSARQTLALAQAAAANRRDRKLAPVLALRAAADADLAHARSQEAQQKAQLEQRRGEISELQRTLGLEVTP
jgi:hypothetical protein